MQTSAEPTSSLPAQDFYRHSLAVLNAAGAEFLVGGGHAYARYTEITRHTKDLDLFVRQSDFHDVLGILSDAGYRTEVTFPHWLGKAFCGDDLVDIIHSSGNGVVAVDDEWFDHAVPARVLDVPVLVCPVEEIIWSKAFVMERERFDGADVLHLFRKRAADLDWDRLLRRFGAHYRVLFAHIMLFGFVYPGDRDLLPRRVIRELSARFASEERTESPDVRVCRGTLLSRSQYLVDVERWGYEDARADPDVHMSAEQIAQWTAAIADEIRAHGAAPEPPSEGGGY